MPTAEEYLRQDIGQMIASLLIQLAMVKAERDQLKQQTEREAAPQEHAR
jgi:hypothetical protein